MDSIGTKRMRGPSSLIRTSESELCSAYIVFISQREGEVATKWPRNGLLAMRYNSLVNEINLSPFSCHILVVPLPKLFLLLFDRRVSRSAILFSLLMICCTSNFLSTKVVGFRIAFFVPPLASLIGLMVVRNVASVIFLPILMARSMSDWL